MTLKIGYFQPVVMFTDTVPPVEFSKIFNLVDKLHMHPELDSSLQSASLRGGQQIQVYPNELEIDVAWLLKWLESVCVAYMEIVNQQSLAEDLKYCKPVITSVWTIQQHAGDYQEMHSHPASNISGNIYITAPEFEDKHPSDGQLLFRLPQTRDVSKFIMADTWKYDPEPGTYVVFPSYVPHTVYPWKGMGPRTVVSFEAKLLPKEEV